MDLFLDSTTSCVVRPEMTGHNVHDSLVALYQAKGKESAFMKPCLPLFFLYITSLT